MRFRKLPRLSKSFWVFAVFLTVAIPYEAQGKDIKIVGVGSTSFGFTDNVFNAPPNPAPGVAGAQWDLFMNVSPGVGLLYEKPRLAARLDYTFTFHVFFRNPQLTSYSNMLNWAERIATSPTTTLSLGESATQSGYTTFGTLSPASSTTVQAAPSGSTLFFTNTFQEGFVKEFSPTWNASQTAGFTLYAPLNARLQRSYAVNASLNAQHSWTDNAIGAAVDASYVRFTSLEGAGAINPERSQIIASAVGRWHHAYGEYFSTELDGGAIEAMRADDAGGRVLEPTVLASIRYTRQERGDADLSFTHTIQPNLYLAETFLTDRVSLRGSVPIKQTYFSVSATAGVQRSRALNQNGDTSAPLDLFESDVALLYRPVRISTHLLFSARYQFFDQIADQTPQPGFTALPRFIRNTVMISVEGTYPDPEAPTQPLGTSAEEKLLRDEETRSKDVEDDERPKNDGREAPSGEGDRGTENR